MYDEKGASSTRPAPRRPGSLVSLLYWLDGLGARARNRRKTELKRSSRAARGKDERIRAQTTIGTNRHNSKVLARCTGTHARARDTKNEPTAQPRQTQAGCPTGRNSHGDGGAASASSRSLATHAASQSNLVPAHRSVRRAFPRDDPPHVLIWRLNSPHSIPQGTPAAPTGEAFPARTSRLARSHRLEGTLRQS
jgi:hypothetical protein